MLDVNGLESFKGVVIHSSEYRTGSAFKGNDVLVVGSGNSGMEINFDLFEAGARTSVVVRSPVSRLHVLHAVFHFLFVVFLFLFSFGVL